MIRHRTSPIPIRCQAQTTSTPWTSIRRQFHRVRSPSQPGIAPIRDYLASFRTIPIKVRTRTLLHDHNDAPASCRRHCGHQGVSKALHPTVNTRTIGEALNEKAFPGLTTAEPITLQSPCSTTPVTSPLVQIGAPTATFATLILQQRHHGDPGNVPRTSRMPRISTLHSGRHPSGGFVRETGRLARRPPGFFEARSVRGMVKKSSPPQANPNCLQAPRSSSPSTKAAVTMIRLHSTSGLLRRWSAYSAHCGFAL